MTWKVPGPRIGWRPLERIAFGLIYGAIMVLSLLMAMNEAGGSPFDMAIVLFGSVFAITLARAFAELLSHAIQTGERILTRQALTTAWRGSHPTLSVANLPTALLVAAERAARNSAPRAAVQGQNSLQAGKSATAR